MVTWIETTPARTHVARGCVTNPHATRCHLATCTRARHGLQILSECGRQRDRREAAGDRERERERKRESNEICTPWSSAHRSHHLAHMNLFFLSGAVYCTGPASFTWREGRPFACCTMMGPVLHFGLGLNRHGMRDLLHRNRVSIEK